MSFYYKQNFVSAEPLYAEVKLDLQTYFSSGAIDDLLFPKWTEQCLQRFKKSSYRILETILEVCGYEACLPPDFNSVRELWGCHVTYRPTVYQNPSSYYYQTDFRIDVASPSFCGSDIFERIEDCNFENFAVMHKVTSTIVLTFQKSFLLTPGNHHARGQCGECCTNIGASTPHTFDIQNGKIITNFSEGTLYMLYYAEPSSAEGEQLVPDNFYVQEYIKKYIIYKCFSQLANRVTDESFNQIQAKKQEADREQAEAFITASTELKKDAPWDKIRKIKNSYNSLQKYRLGGNNG